LSRSDTAVALAGTPQGCDQGPVDGATPAALLDGVEMGPLLPDGLVVCALRELFEEIGILLTTPDAPTGRLGEERGRLLDKSVSFADLMSELDLTASAERLVYAGRWLTPPMGPMRFDNRFFLLEWTEALGEPEIIPGELDEGEWIAPQEALDRWQSGSVWLAPPIVHLLKVLGEEGPEGGLERMRYPVEANIGEHRRIEFRPGVLHLPQPTPTLPPATHTNAYLIGEGEAVLIDPGSPYAVETDRLEGALGAWEAQTGGRVQAIVLTHHHPDHVGGVAPLQKRLNLPVRAHAETMARLEGMGIEFSEPLEEGETIVLAGGETPILLDVLHTPGHARGHVCLHEASRGWIFGGDMVAGFGTIVIDPPEGNMEQYLGSLRRLEVLDARALFPGHGPVMLDPSAKFAEYVEHRLWREEQILAAWAEGKRRPEEMLATVYEDVPAIAHPLAVRQIMAHLERLESLGRLA
jgi:glyoxylase-like metal-dependent hydrolase (beta-lactamase superfamily II)/8-oxo-dGTP pyrophosphatase MutT (NUDIX family)